MSTTLTPASPKIPVTLRRRSGDPVPLVDHLFRTDLATDLRRAHALADWLDTKFSIAGMRFGFDTILGLIPVAGDTLGALIGLYPLFIARRHGLGKLAQSRMGLNLLIEWAVGSV